MRAAEFFLRGAGRAPETTPTSRNEPNDRRPRLDHGYRFAAQLTNHCLRCQRLDSASAGVERPEGTRNPGRGLQRHSERGRALFVIDSIVNACGKKIVPGPGTRNRQ